MLFKKKLLVSIMFLLSAPMPLWAKSNPIPNQSCSEWRFQSAQDISEWAQQVGRIQVEDYCRLTRQNKNEEDSLASGIGKSALSCLCGGIEVFALNSIEVGKDAISIWKWTLSEKQAWEKDWKKAYLQSLSSLKTSASNSAEAVFQTVSHPVKTYQHVQSVLAQKWGHYQGLPPHVQSAVSCSLWMEWAGLPTGGAFVAQKVLKKAKSHKLAKLRSDWEKNMKVEPFVHSVPPKILSSNLNSSLLEKSTKKTDPGKIKKMSIAKSDEKKFRMKDYLNILPDRKHSSDVLGGMIDPITQKPIYFVENPEKLKGFYKELDAHGKKMDKSTLILPSSN